ncbi:hypothetical protein KKG58_02580 [Patescibacteria group bacterium]|nr:hypothetical protein [Patescibacteria group bacterium]
MFDYFKLFISLFIPWLIGAGVLSLFKRRFSASNWPRPVWLVFSFALGVGLISYLMFWSGLIGLSLKVFMAILTGLAGILAVFYLMKFAVFNRGKFLVKEKTWFKNLFSLNFKIDFLSIVKIILVLIIIFQTVFIFTAASLRPHIYVDILENWGWKAKVFFYQPDQAFNSQSSLFLGGESHRHYPLHVPLFMTWIYSWLGEVNDALVNVVFAFYFIALLILVYFTLRSWSKHGSWRNALNLALTAVLATLPLLNYHGFNAYADLPLTFYFTLAVVCFLNYLKNRSRLDLVLAALFAGLSIWVKNTGLVLSAVIFIVFLIYLINSYFKKDWRSVGKDFLFFCFWFVFFISPWLVFKEFFAIVYLGNPAIAWFHPEVIPAVFQQIFFLRSFHFWPGIFILILLFSWRQLFPGLSYSHGRIRISRARGEDYAIRMLFLIILGVIAAYFSLYLFTTHYEYVIDGTSVGRNFLTLMPISVLLAGLLLKDIFGNRVPKETQSPKVRSRSSI